jgi:hypothetical protein
MSDPTISELLQYSRLQMAAEAFLVGSDGSLKEKLKDALTEGNKHASKFTDVDATAFLAEWEVVTQKANTGTGFSGTLFRCKVTDPAKGLVAGQLILSMRSTEFIDDYVRDNIATNKQEIFDNGWAFGQIADMEKWYAELSRPPGEGQDAGVLYGQTFAVTLVTDATT